MATTLANFRAMTEEMNRMKREMEEMKRQMAALQTHIPQRCFANVKIPEEYLKYKPKSRVQPIVLFDEGGRLTQTPPPLGGSATYRIGGTSKLDYLATELRLQSDAMRSWESLSIELANINDNNIGDEDLDATMDFARTDEEDLKHTLYYLRRHRKLGARNGWVTATE